MYGSTESLIQKIPNTGIFLATTPVAESKNVRSTSSQHCPPGCCGGCSCDLSSDCTTQACTDTKVVASRTSCYAAYNFFDTGHCTKSGDSINDVRKAIEWEDPDPDAYPHNMNPYKKLAYGERADDGRCPSPPECLDAVVCRLPACLICGSICCCCRAVEADAINEKYNGLGFLGHGRLPKPQRMDNFPPEVATRSATTPSPG